MPGKARVKGTRLWPQAVYLAGHSPVPNGSGRPETALSRPAHLAGNQATRAVGEKGPASLPHRPRCKLGSLLLLPRCV